MEQFTLKELVMEMRDDIKAINAQLKNIVPDHLENTAFRKKVMNAVVGAAFTALAALGLTVLKITGIIHLGR